MFKIIRNYTSPFSGCSKDQLAKSNQKLLAYPLNMEEARVPTLLPPPRTTPQYPLAHNPHVVSVRFTQVGVHDELFHDAGCVRFGGAGAEGGYDYESRLRF